MGYEEPYDVEKRAYSSAEDTPVVDGLEKRHGHFIADDGAVPGETFEVGDTFYAKAMRLAGKLRIEQRGIERVPEDERADNGFKALLNAGTMVRMIPDMGV